MTEGVDAVDSLTLVLMDGDEIKAAMARKGVSVRELARRTHFDVGYISRALNGRQSASGALERAIVNALDLNDDDERVQHATEHPTRLDAATVEVLGDLLAAQRRADDVVGPRALLPAAETHREALLGMLKDARGPHRDGLAEVVAEHVQFVGWLRVESRDDRQGVAILAEALQLADDIGNGVLASQALNFLGYSARQQGNPVAAARWFKAAFDTPGSRPTQRMGDAAQVAWALGVLGEHKAAGQLLREAEGLGDAVAADTPPGTAYWGTLDYQSLNLGLAHMGLGNRADARDHLAHGLNTLPSDMRGSVWAQEYREALAGC